MVKVAIVHDFLMQMGGAEKVVEVMHQMFPDAPIYTSAYDPNAMPAYYRTWDIRTSFLQRLPFKQKIHRLALPLYPMAFEGFDLSDYDLVLSSSSAFAKGVITQPHTTHICYTHAPMRYAWMTRTYVNNEKIGKLLQLLLRPGMNYLRLWDAVASSRVDHYVANSSAVARRIEKFYRRACDVVFPPVDLARFQRADDIGDYYILVSRFVPYKRLDIAVDAFTQMGRRLIVVGGGRQMESLKERAGPTIEFPGRVDDVELPNLLARAKAYIMPGEEDFGIAPVEANACGRPVIAYKAGGALDTQLDGVTGVLFVEQTVAGLCAAIERADAIAFDPAIIQAHAQLFSTEVFKDNLYAVIQDALLGEQAPLEKYSRTTGSGENGPDYGLPLAVVGRSVR